MTADGEGVRPPEGTSATAEPAEAPAQESAAQESAGPAEAAATVPESASAGEPARPDGATSDRRSPARRRDPLASALIGVLTLLLGFAFAVQVRATDTPQQLEGAREEDLVRILDELSDSEERLRAQIADQREAIEQLSSSDSREAAAIEEAQDLAESIGILNGTVAATGPGITLSIRDPADEVQVADLLDAIQELRGAGAETMQIDDVRVGVSTAVTGDPGRLMIDGRPITAPYEFLVIGSPQDMATAMSIPGGVVQQVNNSGGSVEITQLEEVVVDALRPLDTPQYASPQTDD